MSRTDAQAVAKQAARTTTSYGQKRKKEGEVIDLTSEGVVTDEDTQTACKVRQTPPYPLIFPFPRAFHLPFYRPFYGFEVS